MKKINVTISILPSQVEKYRIASKEIAYKTNEKISDYIGRYIEGLHDQVISPDFGREVFAKADIKKTPPPPSEENCGQSGFGNTASPPHIISPAKNLSYHINPRFC